MSIVAGVWCFCVVDRAFVVWLREDHPAVEALYMESTVVASFVTLSNMQGEFSCK